MKNKTLGILAILAALSTSTFAVTGSVSTSLEIESVHSTAEVTDNTKGDNVNQLDKITVGINTRLNLSEKTSLMIDVKNSNQDYLETSTTGVSAKGRTKVNVVVDNNIIKTPEGARLNLGYGFEVWQDLTGQTSGPNKGVRETLYYKLIPSFSYPVTKNLALTGNYMLEVEKVDSTVDGIGEYIGYYELYTGVKYTGIKNYTLEAQLYNYIVDPTITQATEEENQIRASISTTVAGYKIKPNIKLDLGDYEIKDTSGAYTVATRHRNEYEIEISKLFNKVNYTVAYRYCTADYTKSTQALAGKADEYTNFIKLQAQYSF